MGKNTTIEFNAREIKSLILAIGWAMHYSDMEYDADLKSALYKLGKADDFGRER